MADKKFELGQVVETRGISEKRKANQYFDFFVLIALKRYRDGDWGDVSEEDKERNDYALKHGERIHAAYIYDDMDLIAFFSGIDIRKWKPKSTKEKEKNSNKLKIWIITEWDRSVTTILFPDEY